MSDLIKINETIQTIKNSNKPELDLLVKNLDKALLGLSQEELIPIHNNILQSIKDGEFKNHFNKISIQGVFHSRLTDHSVIFKAEEKKRKIQEEEDKKAEAERKKLEEKETKDIEAERIIKAEEKKIKDEEERAVKEQKKTEEAEEKRRKKEEREKNGEGIKSFFLRFRNKNKKEESLDDDEVKEENNLEETTTEDKEQKQKKGYFSSIFGNRKIRGTVELHKKSDFDGVLSKLSKEELTLNGELIGLMDLITKYRKKPQVILKNLFDNNYMDISKEDFDTVSQSLSNRYLNTEDSYAVKELKHLWTLSIYALKDMHYKNKGREIE